MSGAGNSGGERGREVVRASSQFLGHGMTMAASAALFGWVGSEIGSRVGAEEILTLLGVLLGGAAGFYSMYVRLVIRPREERGKEESDDD